MADKDTFIKDDDKKVNPDNLSDVSGGIKFSVAGGNVGGNVDGLEGYLPPINKDGITAGGPQNPVINPF